MLTADRDGDDQHFHNKYKLDDYEEENGGGGGGGGKRISTDLKVKDRLRQVSSLFSLRDSFADCSGSVSILPICATIIMRSSGGNGAVSNHRKKIRESSLGFRVLLGVKLRRRISHEGFMPVVSLVSALILFLFFLISVLAPSPIGRAENVRSGSNRLAIFRVPSSGGSSGSDLWSSKSSDSYYGCCNASDKYYEQGLGTYPNHYLLIATSGGLNQQRTGITDAVVAARILNATLVVPKLDQKSFWKDDSNFSEIFDVDWFISYLSKDVRIIKQTPVLDPGRKLVSMRVPRKCTPRCYETHVLPVLKKRKVVQLSKYDYRLSNRLDSDLQKLRCKVNYHALKFTDSIRQMGQMLVQRMRMKSRHFIALHLRFESDMLAFSGCYYGGGEKEGLELGAIRKRWKSLHASNPEKERRHGKCPLTPEEVGLMLRALGYGSDVHIYVASGEVYGGEETLAPLKALFPNFHTKETISNDEELAPFMPFSSRMAALDFIVCDESDVFVTNNNGNMAKILAGRRRYFGHKPTIRPNAKKLYKLFQNRNNRTWEEFASRVRTSQKGFMGEPNEVRPGRGEFHENPAACICQKSDRESSNGMSQELRFIDKYPTGNSTVKGDESFTDDDQDEFDLDYVEAEYLRRRIITNSTDPDHDIMLKSEEPELEEMLSD
uniref:O-fucosyltransferase family protein n=1 Tax=Kalanchoe fedtschenkoi TaxID=63787 RepID=A0A7N0V025_KALFE